MRKWQNGECNVRNFTHFFPFGMNSEVPKFKVTCKNADFECPYIRTHTKEKPSQISDITFAILPSYQKNTQTDWLS